VNQETEQNQEEPVQKEEEKEASAPKKNQVEKVFDR